MSPIPPERTAKLVLDLNQAKRHLAAMVRCSTPIGAAEDIDVRVDVIRWLEDHPLPTTETQETNA